MEDGILGAADRRFFESLPRELGSRFRVAASAEQVRTERARERPELGERAHCVHPGENLGRRIPGSVPDLSARRFPGLMESAAKRRPRAEGAQRT